MSVQTMGPSSLKTWCALMHLTPCSTIWSSCWLTHQRACSCLTLNLVSAHCLMQAIRLVELHGRRQQEMTKLVKGKCVFIGRICYCDQEPSICICCWTLQVNGGSSATVDTVNGESLTASPAGGGALLFRGRQSAATTVRTDLRTCHSVVDFINQVRLFKEWLPSLAIVCAIDWKPPWAQTLQPFQCTMLGI
jgi:hypothetical protein